MDEYYMPNFEIRTIEILEDGSRHPWDFSPIRVSIYLYYIIAIVLIEAEWRI